MTFYRYKFDFEVGLLAKSPCKECEKRRKEFPHCIETCEMLEYIQTTLAETRSCARAT
jgi:hypothetical protein